MAKKKHPPPCEACSWLREDLIDPGPHNICRLCRGPLDEADVTDVTIGDHQHDHDDGYRDRTEQHHGHRIARYRYHPFCYLQGQREWLDLLESIRQDNLMIPIIGMMELWDQQCRERDRRRRHLSKGKPDPDPDLEQRHRRERLALVTPVYQRRGIEIPRCYSDPSAPFPPEGIRIKRLPKKKGAARAQ